MIKHALSYLSDPAAPTASHLVMLAIYSSAAVFVLTLIAPLILSLVQKKSPRWLWYSAIRRVLTPIRWTSLVWLLLFVLRYESLAPFTSRLWAWIVVIPFLAWLVWILRTVQKDRPVMMAQHSEHQHYAQYLPQPKKAKVKSRR